MNPERYLLRRSFLCLLFVVLCALSGCSFPKIIILHDPLSAEEHYRLGSVYESQGNLDLAAAQYGESLKKDPRFVKSVIKTGELSFRTKQYSQAESAYKKALTLQPENGDLYNNLCWVYLEQNRELEKAEELIRQAMIKNQGHHAYYLDTLGVILLKQARTAEAIVALKEAVEAIPRRDAAYLAEAFTHLAEAYRVSGDEPNARAADESAERVLLHAGIRSEQSPVSSQ